MEFFDILLAKKLSGGGGGGGSLDLHPKVTMNVTAVNENTNMVNNAIVVGDYWVVIQGNNAVTERGYLDEDNCVQIKNGETKEVTCVAPLDSNTVAPYKLISNVGHLQDITIENCVNCEGFMGDLEITDNTQDASADVTFFFSPIS